MLTSVAVAGTVVGFFPPKNGSFIAHLTVLTVESAPMMRLNPFLIFLRKSIWRTPRCELMFFFFPRDGQGDENITRKVWMLATAS